MYFFFSRKPGEKKIQVYFFFSLKKFTCHSLNFSGGALIKNKGESYIFPKMPILTPFYVVFFFSLGLYFFFLYFFFPEKSLNFTHSLVSNLVFFFRYRKKKNTPFLLTHSILDKIVTNVNFPAKQKTVPLRGYAEIQKIFRYINICDFTLSIICCFCSS